MNKLNRNHVLNNYCCPKCGGRLVEIALKEGEKPSGIQVDPGWTIHCAQHPNQRPIKYSTWYKRRTREAVEYSEVAAAYPELAQVERPPMDEATKQRMITLLWGEE